MDTKLSLHEKKELYFNRIISFIEENKPTKKELAKEKVRLCKELSVSKIPTDIEIMLNTPNEKLQSLRKYLMTKPMRTGSGVAVVAIMTAPFRCPHGKCTYCPGGPNSYFGDVPMSYTGNEPATMRGIRNDYDAYLQVMNRLEQYVAIGQNPDKVELIIMGGTFPSYAKEYQEGFARDAFMAMNDFGEMFFKESGQKGLDLDKFKEFFELPGSIKDVDRTKRIKEKLLALKQSKKEIDLLESQKINQTAFIRCIGMTIETKPDWGLLDHGNTMLKLGCTRVELGIQTLYEEVLKETHRGHNLQDSKDSIRILKDLGFKLNFHMMPGLPNITREQDIWCFEELFKNQVYKPDMLKVYPTMVMPGTKLFLDYKQGKYTPLSTEQAADIISEMVKFVPKYCRIMRVQRDIPTKYSKAGVDKNNLRQLVENKMEEKGYVLNDIKAREIGRNKIKDPVVFETIKYESSNSTDYFISLVDANDKLLGFVRLRLISETLRPEFTKKSAIIRELHVYGEAVAIGDDGLRQHRGFGKKLMAEAERIAKENGKDKMLVISGVGVREYYKKIGYELEGPYMVKKL
ncbi:MAG: tRNA uridine(34) 5-carboxymethylaminomethyl modification radical SAM/GNAT enzyme Elp3 [Candidatus Woesearchaeota archaeon]